MNTQIDLSKFNSINAQGAGSVSSRYAFIPTTRVVDLLAQAGWMPAKATEKNARKEENRGFQEHMIRFRRMEDIETVHALVTHRDHVVRKNNALAEFPEIILVNAHDGGKSFNIMAGLFRLVCSNGLIIADSTFATHKIKHVGFQDQNVIDAVFHVVETTPKILGKINDFKQIELKQTEQEAFAMAAMVAKYGEDDPLLARANFAALARPVRIPDRMDPSMQINSLWNTFNIVQEKLVEKGGRFLARKEYAGRGLIRGRGISSVSENVRVNQALWQLTEKMAELKGATA